MTLVFARRTGAVGDTPDLSETGRAVGALPLVVLLLLLFFTSIGSSHAEPLKGEEIRGLLVGKRIYLATPFGGEFPAELRLPDQEWYG